MSVAEIYDAVMAFDDDQVPELVQAEVDAGTDLNAILNDGIIAALDEIGERFSAGTLFVPEMLMAADASLAGLDILRPLLAETGATAIGTVVIGTVKGDLHDIGKNLVGMMLEGAGFNIVDLGTDVDSDHFISAARDNGADIIAISGLLSTSMSEMQATVTAVLEANANSNLNVKVIVGGPPVNQDFAVAIGADGYSDDAPNAVGLARGLVA